MGQNGHDLLLILFFIPDVFAALVSEASVFFIEALLEQFLEQFSLSPTTLGLSFMTMAVPFGISLVILGWISDKYLSSWTTCTIGLLALLASFLMIGPAPFIPLDPSYEATLVSLFLAGCANAVIQV